MVSFDRLLKINRANFCEGKRMTTLVSERMRSKMYACPLCMYAVNCTLVKIVKGVFRRIEAFFGNTNLVTEL